MIESIFILCVVCKTTVIMFDDSSSFNYWCHGYRACVVDLGNGKNIIFVAKKDLNKYVVNDLCNRTVWEHEVYRAIHHDYSPILDGCH